MSGDALRSIAAFLLANARLSLGFSSAKG